MGERLTFSLNLLNTAETWNVAQFVEDRGGEVTQLLPNRTADGNGALTGGRRGSFPVLGRSFSSSLAGRPARTGSWPTRPVSA